MYETPRQAATQSYRFLKLPMVVALIVSKKKVWLQSLVHLYVVQGMLSASPTVFPSSSYYVHFPVPPVKVMASLSSYLDIAPLVGSELNPSVAME
jgi:hypothetical protein